MDLTIFIDGGSRGNPGPAAAGVVIRDRADDCPLHEAGYFIGRATNNVAEYKALIKALEVGRQFESPSLHIHSDSELLVKQMTGEYRVRSSDLVPLHAQAQSLLIEVEAWQIRHVPREANRRADELANLAMDRKCDVIVYSSLGQAAASASAMVLPADVPLPAPSSEAVAPPQRPAQPRVGSPRWTAEFIDPPQGPCGARCAAGTVFTFGPGTPEGMCIHAAAVILDEGPLVWNDPQQRQDTTFCPRCRAKIRIERIDE